MPLLKLFAPGSYVLTDQKTIFFIKHFAKMIKTVDIKTDKGVSFKKWRGKNYKKKCLVKHQPSQASATMKGLPLI